MLNNRLITTTKSLSSILYEDSCYKSALGHEYKAALVVYLSFK